MHIHQIPVKFGIKANAVNPPVARISDTRYEVAGSQKYTVAAIGADLNCSCLAGQHRRACYHVAAVAQVIFGDRELRKEVIL